MIRRPSWRVLTSDCGGLAAIEFALIAPLMVPLLLGSIELGNMFRIQAKVNTAAGQLAELVAGMQSVTAPGGTLADMCTGAAMNLLPFNSAMFSADIASMTNAREKDRTPGSNSSTVYVYLDWESVSSCPTASPTTMGTSGALSLANSPSSLLTKTGQTAVRNSDLAVGYSAIIVQATFAYTNVLPFFLGKSITFVATATARPRQNSEIKCTNTAQTAACPSLQ